MCVYSLSLETKSVDTTLVETKRALGLGNPLYKRDLDQPVTEKKSDGQWC